MDNFSEKSEDLLLVEKVISQDYEGFLDILFEMEFGSNHIQNKVLYQEFMDDDSMTTFLSSRFRERLEDIDWRPHYVSHHFDYLLTYASAERNQLVSTLYAFYQDDTIVDIHQVDGFGQLSDRVKEHLEALLTKPYDYFQLLREEYQELLSEKDILSASPGTFNSFLDLVISNELILEKEQFLSKYAGQLKTEVDKQIEERQEASRSFDI